MLKVTWTEKAKNDYWGNIEYLQNRWGAKVTINFIEKVEEIIDVLLKENIKFKPTNYENVYQVLVVEQITLYYKKSENNIDLLRFWNNYQNPKKLSF